MKTVIFVSDSSLDVYSNKALIGTEAYRSFLEILAIFNLSINDTLLYNEKDLRVIEEIAVSDLSVKVVTIGDVSKEIIEDLSIPFYALPPINKLPKEQSLDFDIQMKECLGFINDYQDP